jgi:hypothetical protein
MVKSSFVSSPIRLRRFLVVVLQYFDGMVWGRARRCTDGLFCGFECQAVVERFISRWVRREETCKMMVSGDNDGDEVEEEEEEEIVMMRPFDPDDLDDGS